MRLSPGAQLGPYEILAPAGAGGMGEVYRARDTRLDRLVAVKTVSAAVATDPDLRARFQREARIISSLSHPHICALFDVGRQDDVDFVVMEYLEGDTLADRLRRGPLPLDQVLSVAVQIADALAAAHRAGVTHRDLKPGNIMLTKSGAKLLDFGLARSDVPVSGLSVAATMTTPITTEGSILGTCQYMSPEQIQGRPADARSDIFAFGAVLYEAATGQKAFDGKSPVSILSAILEREPEPVRTLRPVTPPGLDRLISACLAKDPDSRWQSALDVKLQLQAIREGGVEAAPRRGAIGAREWIAWALVLLLLLGGLAARAFRPEALASSGASFRASILPPDGMSFSQYHFAVSPDGTRLAFVTIAGDGRTTLSVRSLDTRGTQQIADSDGAAYPFWSPDSSKVAFFSAGQLKVADLSTGTTEKLCEAPIGRGGSWNTDGVILFAPMVDAPISRVSERGGRPQPVTTIPPGSGKSHRWPVFLPDNKHFLFLEEWGEISDPRPVGIYAASIDGGESRLVSADILGSVAYAAGHLLYEQDRSLMAQPFDPVDLTFTGDAVRLLDNELKRDEAFVHSNFSVSRTGVLVFQSLSDSLTELIWYARDGTPVKRSPESGPVNVALSPNDRYLAVSADETIGRSYIRVHDLERGISSRITDGGTEATPAWSPDGTLIAYASRTPVHALYELVVNRGGAPRLLLKGPRMSPNDYTSDGRYLLYMTFEAGAPRLGVYDRVAGSSTIWGRAAEGQYSPDDKWIAYNVATNIFASRVDGTGPRIPICNGCAQPRWSENGDRLYFISSDRKLMEVPIAWANGEPSPGVARMLFQTQIAAPNYALFNYDVTADGTRIVVNSLRPQAPLTMISSWPSLVR
jgi:Tol biopolymer transport system component